MGSFPEYSLPVFLCCPQRMRFVVSRDTWRLTDHILQSPNNGNATHSSSLFRLERKQFCTPFIFRNEGEVRRGVTYVAAVLI
jgi:hypothetical protein